MKYKEFKIGDKVICSIKGKGVVDHIGFYDSEGDLNSNPVRVKFENGKHSYYSIKGELERDYNRTLFIYERKYSKTKAEVLSKYNELLLNVKILPYQELENNYFVKIIDDKNSYSISAVFVRYSDDFNVTYVLQKDADYIVEELNKFIGYKW